MSLLERTAEMGLDVSRSTRVVFSGLLAASFGLALWSHRRARIRPGPSAAASSLWAIRVVVEAAAKYWLLGMSHLSVWLPYQVERDVER